MDQGSFRPLSAYTEVIQDGMLQLLRSGTPEVASATAFALSEAVSRNCGRTARTTATESFFAPRRSATIRRSYAGLAVSR